MAKLAIWVTGKPITSGFKRREFLWNEDLKLFIYEGRLLDEREFNAKWEKAYRNNADLFPQVKIVEFSPPPAPVLDVGSTSSGEGGSQEEASTPGDRASAAKIKPKAGRTLKTELMELS